MQVASAADALDQHRKHDQNAPHCACRLPLGSGGISVKAPRPPVLGRKVQALDYKNRSHPAVNRVTEAISGFSG